MTAWMENVFRSQKPQQQWQGASSQPAAPRNERAKSHSSKASGAAAKVLGGVSGGGTRALVERSAGSYTGLQDFFSWVDKRQRHGDITFVIKQPQLELQ